MWLPHSFIVLLLPVLARGSITNITVDDSDPSFTFTGTWNAITPTSACGICSSNPDPSRIQGGTWHDGNYRDGAPAGTSGSFTFTGSAVYIFGIDQAISQPNIAFTLGSIQQVHHYTGTERFVYRALFFSADGLDADQTHTVNWVFNLAPNTGVEVQVALFDYAIVTSGKEDGKVTSTAVAAGLTPSQSSTNDDNTATSGSDSSTVSRSSASGGSQSKGGPSQSTSSINPTVSPGDQSSSPSTITMSEMSLTTVTAQSAQLAISHSKSNIGAIVGGVVGALMAVTLAILFIWLRSRKVVRVSPEKDPSARSRFLRIEDYPMSNSLHPTNTHEVGIPLSSLKRYEGRVGGPSTTSLLTPSDDLSTPIPATPESSTLFRPPPETEPPAPGATSRDLRLMEERLATLEAQIAVHQHPPPYVNEDDE